MGVGGCILSTGVDCIYVVCILCVVHSMTDGYGLYVVHDVCWVCIWYVYGVYDSQILEGSKVSHMSEGSTFSVMRTMNAKVVG